jgi:predicted alternative tryptophan synthase beta-subunit
MGIALSEAFEEASCGEDAYFSGNGDEPRFTASTIIGSGCYKPVRMARIILIIVEGGGGGCVLG